MFQYRRQDEEDEDGHARALTGLAAARTIPRETFAHPSGCRLTPPKRPQGTLFPRSTPTSPAATKQAPRIAADARSKWPGTTILANAGINKRPGRRWVAHG